MFLTFTHILAVYARVTYEATGIMTMAQRICHFYVKYFEIIVWKKVSLWEAISTFL